MNDFSSGFSEGVVKASVDVVYIAIEKEKHDELGYLEGRKEAECKTDPHWQLWVVRC